MEDKSLKEQLEEKERSLVALLAQHDLAGGEVSRVAH